ncbi:hypothetical protein FA95DRAFT_1580761 [Auriscalpium vulgare]|uniref:Uncharacterized protein n=1 Tax=Auriscalpium vulgare TaxID=40419 RepID=A0ACB8S427_9AGAM|nr:hypothetical protein FA95DRAFT_1580761 [Auriscalpium vulgare]
MYLRLCTANQPPVQFLRSSPAIHEARKRRLAIQHGPSSTGKTTLCNPLAAQLGLSKEVYITEVARTVMRVHGFTRHDVAKLEMQRAIMEAQLARDACARTSAAKAAGPGVILSDRSAVDAVVYAALNDAEDGGTRAQTLIASPQFQEALTEYRQSYFILLHPIATWLVDDGIRSLDTECLREFRDKLSQLGIPFIELGGSCRWLEERMAAVRRYAMV